MQPSKTFYLKQKTQIFMINTKISMFHLEMFFVPLQITFKGGETLK